MLPCVVDVRPATSEDLALAKKVERKVLASDASAADALKTSHFLHAGMYARTLFAPAGIILTGCFVVPPTVLVIQGDVTITAGESSVKTLTGYNVLKCAGGRKQVFLTHTDVHMTVLFPTSAKTTADAEKEFTLEADALLSHGD